MVAIGFNWVGDPERGRQHVAELRAIGAPVAEAAEEISYADLQTGGDEGMRHGLRRYWKSHYLRELSDGAIAAFVSRGDPPPGMPVTGFMQVYQGAIAEVGPDESAFSQRDAVFEFVTIASWEDPAEDEARIGAYRRYGEAVAPHASGVYVNGLADEGASGITRAYRQRTLERLVALKDRYDPDNVFHLNHNVGPAGQARG